MNRFVRAAVSVWVVSGCAANLKTEAAVTAAGQPTGAAVTATVGPAGGTVRSTDGTVELVVPAGALAADTALSVTPLSVTAPGGVRAFRLGPDGTTFSAPATLRFTFTPADIAGSDAAALLVAVQDSQRRWVAKSGTLEGSTLSVRTTHLSDWSLTLGYQLRPPNGTVAFNDTQPLTAQFCNVVHTDEKGEELDYVGLVADCQEDGLDPMLSDWSVNGVVGGNTTVGKVAPTAAKGAVFTAPGKAPSPNTVAVSVQLLQKKEKHLLVSNLFIGDALPAKYIGVISHHYKNGGPGTSAIPLEYRVEGHVSLVRSSPTSSSYGLAEGTAVLRQFSKSPTATCHCAASNVTGYVDMGSFRMTLKVKEGVLNSLQWAGYFPAVPQVCMPTTVDCQNPTPVLEVVPWALSGVNPGCTGTSQLTFVNPRQISGSWTLTCPADTVVNGRTEEATWTLDGTD